MLCSYSVLDYGRVGQAGPRRVLSCKAENIDGTTSKLYIPTLMLMMIVENVLQLRGPIDAVTIYGSPYVTADPESRDQPWAGIT